MPLAWNVYKSRKNINLKRWCTSLGLETYGELVRHCQHFQVEPPSRSEFETAMGLTAEPVVEVATSPELPPEPVVEVEVEVEVVTDDSDAELSFHTDEGLWDPKMTKSSLFELALRFGLVEKDDRLTKNKLMDLLLDAGIPKRGRH